MPRVTAAGYDISGKVTVICDYSPPRSGNPRQLPPPPAADFLLVNRNPGRAVRTDSAMLAAGLRQLTGQEVIFALLTRDMNRLALQSYLLGAQLLGLENVVVAQGDPFTGSDAAEIATAADYKPTELIAAITEMNRGRDFRGRRLDYPTDYCIGATLDAGSDIYRQAQLAQAKVAAGAGFLVSQPIFDLARKSRFTEAYGDLAGESCPAPIFWGLQMLELGGVSFGPIPPNTARELELGRSGVAIALELFERFQEAGIRSIYLLPPIRRGGERNYAAAREFLAAVRAGV